jgi:hypothetical protein
LTIELGELRQQAALMAYYVWSHHGLFTQERLQWLSTIVSKELQPSRLRDESIDGIKEQAKLTDAQLAPINADNIRRHAESMVSAPHVDAPFLTAHLGRLVVFHLGTQRQLLHIRTQIQFLNQKIDEAARFSAMTFDALSADNRTRVMGNLKRNEQGIATRAEVLANAIGTLEFK